MELFSAKEGEFLAHFHEYQVPGGWGVRRAMATVNPNVRWMALTSKDGMVLVDTRSGKRQRLFEKDISDISDISGNMMLSPKGKFLALVSEDSARLFQVPSGEQLANISLSGRFTKRRGFDSDEHFYAFFACKDFSCTEGGTLHIVDTTSGGEVSTVHLTDDLYRFSGGGDFIVEYAGHTARIFESATGNEASRIEQDAPIKDAFFAEEDLWLVLVTKGEKAAVVDVVSGKELSRLDWPCRSKSIEHDELGRVLVASCEDGRVQTYEIPTGRRLADFKPRKSVVPSGSSSPLSPDGRFLIASDMHTLQILETESGRELASYDHVHPILGFGSPFGYPFNDDSRRMVFPDAFLGLRVVDTSGPLSVVHREFRPDETPVFSSSARLLATPSPVGFVRVSEVESGATVALIRHDAAAFPVVFSADGSKIITASEDTLQLFDLANKETIAILEYKEGSRGYSRSFSAGFQYMVWRADGANHLIRVDSLEEIGQVPGEEYGDIFEFDPEEELLAAIDANHSNVRLFNTQDGSERNLFKLNARVYYIAFSPDRHSLAVQVLDEASEASTRLLDIRTGRERARLHHGKSLGPIEFSPNGLTLAVLTGAWLFDTTEGREISRVESRLVQWCTSDALGRLPWLSAAFSADSRLFAIGAESVRILDTSTGKERARIEFDAGCKGVTFSPDGRYLAAASDRGLARLLSTETFEALAHVRHAAAVTDLRFSPDNRLLATSSADGSVRLIDTHLEREIVRFELGDAVESVKFSSDGRWVIAETQPEKDDESTSVRLLWSDPEWPFQQLCAKAGHNLNPKEWETVFGDAAEWELTCRKWRSND